MVARLFSVAGFSKALPFSPEVGLFRTGFVTVNTDLFCGSEGVAPWKAHEVRWPGMATAAKPSQQLRTESCVVPGNGHCEA